MLNVSYDSYHISRLKPMMLSKTRREDGSICHKRQNGVFDCPGDSSSSTVMAIPFRHTNFDSTKHSSFEWTNLPILIHPSGKIKKVLQNTTSRVD